MKYYVQVEITNPTVKKILSYMLGMRPRHVIALANIARLYDESIEGGASSTVKIFKLLKCIVDAEETFSKEAKNYASRINKKGIIPSQRHKYRLSISNPISYQFYQMIVSLNQCLEMYAYAKIQGVIRSNSLYLSKQSEMYKIMTKVLAECLNTKEPITEWTTENKQLLAMAMKHPMMPDLTPETSMKYKHIIKK